MSGIIESTNVSLAPGLCIQYSFLQFALLQLVFLHIRRLIQSQRFFEERAGQLPHEKLR